MSKRSIAGIIGILLVVSVLGAAPAQALDLRAPNAKIRSVGGAWFGEDVVDASGAGAMIATNVRPGRSVRYELGADNALRSESYAAVSGCAARSGFRVHYSTETGVDVTDLVLSGTFALGPISGYGEVGGLFVTVKALRDTSLGRTMTCLVTMADVPDFVSRDAVGIVATVR